MKKKKKMSSKNIETFKENYLCDDMTFDVVVKTVASKVSLVCVERLP